jgi:hypothetical protein
MKSAAIALLLYSSPTQAVPPYTKSSNGNNKGKEKAAQISTRAAAALSSDSKTIQVQLHHCITTLLFFKFSLYQSVLLCSNNTTTIGHALMVAHTSSVTMNDGLTSLHS